MSVFFTLSCANIKPPTGGEKDLDPPILLKSIPEHNSTNFASDEITLFFDEQIETKGLINELIITPDDNIQIKETPKKKSLTIRLKDTLRQNTTYNLNFGNSIVDITERNPSQNAVIAFSTGPDIDTAFIKGKAIDMFTQEPLKDVIAVLQPINDTIDIQKHRPAYLSRVDEEGNFTINNLPKNYFRLYAIKDDNGNLIYNIGKEKIALYSDSILPSYNDTVYQLFLSAQDTRPFRLLSTRHHYNYTTFSFNKGIFEYQLEEDSIFSYLSSKTKSLNLFHPFLITDSLAININVTDSSTYNFDSTLYIKNDLLSDTLKPEFSIEIEPKNGDVESIPDTIRLSFNLRLNTFQLDSTLIVTEQKDSIIIDKLDYGKIGEQSYFIINPKPKSKNTIIKIIKNDITSIYNDTIRNVKMFYNLPREEKFGQIDGEVRSDYDNLILQVTDLKGNTKRELLVEPGAFSIRYLDPGTYRLRLIHDENNNGIWDKGDHYKYIQPEKVVIFKEDILIKANWIVQDKILTIK
ncbi:Ig-like domain-containing protein [Hyphobacterium sp. CCMP332]|nr:Ig-like domain-containing protein [Hyphobacterium sp. CCMP332]